MMCRWTVRGHERLKLPGAQDRSRQIEGRFMHDPAVRVWLNAFLDHWLAGGRTASPKAAEDPLPA
jgi:GMP synthase (glutamine-hydrolysing)